MASYNQTNEVKSLRRGGNARNSRCVHPKRIERQEGAKARAAEYAKLTTQQRLDRLDQAFGVGVGAAKERAKLAKRLASEGKPVAITTPAKKNPKQVQAATP